ncbi:uncharacterized protein [Apostichopus japonicus]|uniref:uncharacterized protein n=1 Tax=Stichopus japonicus TaxID=307972 RepID=UPI003AB5792E
MPFGYLGWDSWTTLIVYLQFSDKEEQFITELKAKYEILYHSVQPLPYIRDRMYCALNGFNEDIRDQYIRKAVVQGDEHAAREIILKLQRNPLLGDLCQVPLLFVLFAHMSHENKDLKTVKSVTSFFRFNEDIRDQYIRKAVVQGDEHAAREIILKLQRNPLLGDLCQVPLLFVLFAHMSHENKDLKTVKSVTSFFRFNEDIRDQYIRKAVVQGDEHAAREIILKLQRNPLLGDLCQVPLLFVLFAHMSHENKDLKTVKSVTSFFLCFGSKHDELNKAAFEALSGKNQLIVWYSTSLREGLGDDFYEQYLKTGIFFEEEVLTGDQFLYKNEVRFYHKLFCEWYAAHYIADYLSQESPTSATTESQTVAELLHCLDPFELHYVYRFACGLNKTASGKIVNYLQDNLKHEKFAMMCMLEQDYKNEKIVDAITKLASKVVHVHSDDSQLLQRSTLQVLEFASAKQVKSFSFIAIKTYFLSFVVMWSPSCTVIVQ